MRKNCHGDNLRNILRKSIDLRGTMMKGLKKFYELKLGQLTIDEYVNKSLN
jgi:hypothetical protein